MKSRLKFFILALLFANVISQGLQPVSAQVKQEGWPALTNQARPWSRWWWMGSAVDETNLVNLMSQYGKAGFGGLEVTPIYGAVGFESNYLRYLSPQWMRMLDVSVREAKKNGMGIDMNTGTGWPFGGPQVTAGNAACKLVLQSYSLAAGTKLAEKIIPKDKKQVGYAHLQSVMAFGPDGKREDLTGNVKDDGTLEWTSPGSDWNLVAAFSGKTLQQVKRAAPGGEGLTLDHFSKEATNQYLARFDSAFRESNHGVGCFFNDSYEVYGTNWTNSLFEEFYKRRGYRLQDHLQELSERKPETDVSRRVQCDYRETISELLRENFTKTWTDWAHGKKSLTRNQAHGSPGNLLDLYATVDVPECETFGSSKFDIPGLRRDSSDIRNVDPDPVMMKFASSAANVTGRNLTSCETFTWLAEHFRVSLSQCKPEVEQAFLSGVNHVFYHGTAYSPKEAGWPGWLFYASVNFAPSNSFWPHLRGLNDYIARCQSILQGGTADNDLLVYWPVYDVWMKPGSSDLQLTIHSIDRWLYPTPFCSLVKQLMKEGYTLDFVSDHLLDGLTVKNGMLVTRSGSSYRTLVVPAADNMPVATLDRILGLAAQGATILFQELPKDVPGLQNLEARRLKMKDLLRNVNASDSNTKPAITQTGQGKVVVSGSVGEAFVELNILPENLTANGLKFIRRKSEAGTYYYLVNHTATAVNGFVPLNRKGKGCLLLDPQTSQTGVAQTREENGKMMVRLQLQPGEAIFVLVSGKQLSSPAWPYLGDSGKVTAMTGPWKLQFTQGGAALPADAELKNLVSWTELPDARAHDFSGSAVYSGTLDIKGNVEGEYLLNLGRVCESARVRVNGQEAGILWSIPFSTRIGKFLKPGKNLLEIEVANLMANRIRRMDIDKVTWRNYHEINFVNVDYKSFDASGWKPMIAGLLGPVTITSCKIEK